MPPLFLEQALERRGQSSVGRPQRDELPQVADRAFPIVREVLGDVRRLIEELGATTRIQPCLARCQRAIVQREELLPTRRPRVREDEAIERPACLRGVAVGRARRVQHAGEQLFYPRAVLRPLFVKTDRALSDAMERVVG
jgi:hypothetical protein